VSLAPFPASAQQSFLQFGKQSLFLHLQLEQQQVDPSPKTIMKLFILIDLKLQYYMDFRLCKSGGSCSGRRKSGI